MTIRTTVRLPDELMKQAKRKAASEGRSLTSLLEEGLRDVLAKRPAPSQRVLPRLSDAKGPPLPGIDISNNAAIQELEDMEYVERLKRGFR